MMGYWNVGMMGRHAGAPAVLHYSTIPPFHHSIIPSFQLFLGVMQ
jgi:hypothetical protein